MSHFAKVLNGTVVQVIVANPDFFNTFVDTSPGSWIQTSYNTRGGVHYESNSNNPDSFPALRGNYAGIGYTYDQSNDVFYDQRPKDIDGNVCKSWTISAPTWTWTPPTTYPTDNQIYTWNESALAWVAAPDMAA